MGDEKSLAHTRWNCKYHIVFAPKYRRQAFYGEKRRAVGSILRKLCEWKNVRILEADRSVDVAISRLRKKLLDSAAEPYRIKTIRNKGYLFAPHAWDETTG
ncbi:transposase for insertion sequence element IS200 [Salmonella enterica subsp. enterica serovar Typhi]|nr:transposase for insertion sequence element IS200 [Salmonella enterica subsp. enterica serovar Typhi]